MTVSPGTNPEGLGALVARRRRALGWTLQRLADKVGCARSYLWMIERGQRSSPSEDVLARIEDALGFSRGELVTAARWEAMPRELREQVRELRGTRHAASRLSEILRAGGLDRAHRSGELHRLVEALKPGGNPERKGKTKPGHREMVEIEVPLINRVAAGYPREFTDLGYPAGVADSYVRVPGMTDPDAFACRVVGDSMRPEYREGDIVVFSPLRPIQSGQDCLARLERDAETTFKRVYLEEDETGREVIRLQPLNPAYASRTVQREEVAGLFAAVSVTRVIGRAGER